MSLKAPAYRKHSTRDQALVRIEVNGRRRCFYLGLYGSTRSKEKYQQILAEYWNPTEAKRPGEWATVEELMAAYLRHCRDYYRASNETENVILAMRPLRQLFGDEDTCDFGPRKLMHVRDVMIESGLTRQGVNKRITKLKRMFKWGVAHELVPGRIYVDLSQVDGLKAQRTDAPEAATIEPAQDHDVDAAIELMTAPIAAMVQLQRLTGMRPGEIVIMRRCDIDTTGKVWTYTPSKHKNQWRKHGRRIKIGPRGQEILKTWLPAEFDAFVFSPRRYHGNRKFRDAYDGRQYRKSVYVACDQAGVDRWSPNQLRHAAATQARNEMGIESAAAMLGHSRPDTAAIYAHRNDGFAERTAERLG